MPRLDSGGGISSDHGVAAVLTNLAIQYVCRHLGIDKDYLFAREKIQERVAARGLVYYLCRNKMDNFVSILYLGEVFGYDHSTVQHAVTTFGRHLQLYQQQEYLSAVSGFRQYLKDTFRMLDYRVQLPRHGIDMSLPVYSAFLKGRKLPSFGAVVDVSSLPTRLKDGFLTFSVETLDLDCATLYSEFQMGLYFLQQETETNQEADIRLRMSTS